MEKNGIKQGNWNWYKISGLYRNMKTTKLRLCMIQEVTIGRFMHQEPQSLRLELPQTFLDLLLGNSSRTTMPELVLFLHQEHDKQNKQYMTNFKSRHAWVLAGGGMQGKRTRKC
jgi:hypothetical protein